MKNKLLFLFVMVMAMICLTVAASAASIDDVVFKNGTNEVFVVGAGSISATVDITVEAETSAALVTAAYEGNRLAAVQYEGITLSPAQKTYQGSPVTATANTTNVDVMVWGINDLSPIDTKESLTNVSRQIEVSDFSVTANGKTFNAIVDNEDKVITVEQISDMYTQTSTTKFPVDHQADYESLANATANYLLNGSARSEDVSITLSAPDSIILTADNGRTATYSVKMDQLIGTAIVNLDSKQSPSSTYYTGHVYTESENKIAIKNLYSEPFNTVGYYGGYVGGGNATPFYFSSLNSGYDIRNFQDETADAYFKLDFAERSSNDACIKFIKQGNTGSGPAGIFKPITTTLGNQKAVYSFDFMCESLDKYTALQPILFDNNGIELIILNFEKKSGSDAYYIKYFSEESSDMAGYGKLLAEVPFRQWNNIKIIVEPGSSTPYIVCLNNEVLLKTAYKAKSNAAKPTIFNNGSYLRFGTYSSASTISYLDNIAFYANTTN